MSTEINGFRRSKRHISDDLPAPRPAPGLRVPVPVPEQPPRLQTGGVLPILEYLEENPKAWILSNIHATLLWSLYEYYNSAAYRGNLATRIKFTYFTISYIIRLITFTKYLF